jgi:hypothetical protein
MMSFSTSELKEQRLRFSLFESAVYLADVNTTSESWASNLPHARRDDASSMTSFFRELIAERRRPILKYPTICIRH